MVLAPHPPTRSHESDDAPPSVVASMAMLKIGESFSRVIRYSGPGVDLYTIRQESTDLRNSLGKAAERARKKTGNKYTVEAIDSRTADMAIIAGIVVTRIS